MRPNVLLIYTDQQRKDSMGCYGNSLAITPNLDKLAEEGAKFNNYFVQSPVCMASRMSFLTGKYCSNLGIGANGVPLPEDAQTIATLLKPYGYHCGQLGKLHFKPHAKRNHKNPHPLYGFDTMILSDEPGCYDDAYIKWVEDQNPQMVDKVRSSLPDAALQYYKTGETDIPRNTHEPYVFEGEEDLTHSRFVAEETKEFLKQHQKEPFLCIAGFYAPHTPVNPPKKYIDMYQDVVFPMPKTGKDEEVMDVLKDIDEEKWQEIIRYYMALVTHVDDCVGDILSTLKDLGLEENTIVIFTSDHGEFLGDHGRIQKGRPGHDCIINVPMLIKYPQVIEKNMVLEQLVEGVDILPTILEYCKIQIPDDLQGLSLKDLLAGKTQDHKDEIFMEYIDPKVNDRPLLCHSTLRTADYKYYISDVEEGLFDLKKDPDELTNEVNHPQYSEIVSHMRRRMIRKLQTVKWVDTNFEAEY